MTELNEWREKIEKVIGHYYCEDHWYSCPEAEGGCANDSVEECDCGRKEKVDSIMSLLSSYRSELRKRVEGMRKLPYYARLAQNRNGLEYCSTCEQAWEQCSCSARNTGYSRALDDILSLLREKEDK